MNYFVTIISILGGAQGLFLAFSLLALKKHRLQANKFLAFVIMILSVTLIIAFLHFSRLILRVPHLYNVTPLFTLLYGPLLFFYVRSLLNPERRVLKLELLHFLPFIAGIWLQWPMLNMSGKTKTSYMMNIFEDRFLPALNTFSVLRLSHLAVYLVICLTITLAAAKSHRQRADNAPYQPRLFWIKSLLLGSFVVWGLYTFFYFYDQHWLNMTTPMVITVVLYGIGYFGLRFPELFRDIQVQPLRPKYEASRLGDKDKDLYSARLVRLLEEEKLYIQPDLKLQTLAQRLEISSQSLSQIINEKYGQNLSEFVNTYRIEEARRLLLDVNHKHLTIAAIAGEVGFNSKSAFNTAFKKFTNQTPSEFVKSHNPPA